MSSKAGEPVKDQADSAQHVPQTRIQQRNRREIVDAVIDVIAEHGFDGATMDLISAKAGLSRTNIHYYFKSKDELFREAIVQTHKVWGDLWTDLDENGNPHNELRKYIKGKLRASWEQPKLSRVFAAEIMRGAPMSRHLMQDEMRKMFDGACDTLRNWMQQGYLAKIDPLHVFITIWGATQYYADFDLVVKLIWDKDKFDDDDFEAAAEAVSTIIMKGMEGATRTDRSRQGSSVQAAFEHSQRDGNCPKVD